MNSGNEFYEQLITTCYNNIHRFYINNYDEKRFGKRSISELFVLYIYKFIYFLLRLIKSPFLKIQNNYHRLENNLLNISNYNYLYDLLENKESKDLLIKICAFNILGNEKIKIFNKKEFFKPINELKKQIISKDTINLSFLGFKLNYFSLKEIGYNIELFSNLLGVHTCYVMEHYAYKTNDALIKVEKNDYVIDAGACYGDTSLYFADLVGEKGKVFSFEFIPENIDVLKKNLSINPSLISRIQVVKNPLWSDSQTELYFENNGPASCYSLGKNDKALNYKTISIDDYVEKNSISKINFIKMDIEGSEIEALKGAINTIKKHKPKLAISLYHKISDFKEIPQFINSLNIGYKFYLAHRTIHCEETLLFAIVDKN